MNNIHRAKEILESESKIKEFAEWNGLAVEIARRTLEHLISQPEMAEEFNAYIFSPERSEDFKGYTAGEEKGYQRGHEAGFAKGLALGGTFVVAAVTLIAAAFSNR